MVSHETKIISWNVNGIRAWYKKGKLEWVLKQNPDIFCFQETKAHKDQLPEELLNIQGYKAYFNNSDVKKGYSGVAVYTKQEPNSVEESFINGHSDEEGRFLALFFNDFILINCYFPNGGGPAERLKYKLDFYNKFLDYLKKIEKMGKPIISCGDFNVAHTEIDIARPKENVDHVGFLPEERAWFDKLMANGYVDTFRFLYPDKKDIYTFWDMKTFARDRNIGWRIDYFVISEKIKNKILNCEIHENILGSDHCPISLKIGL